jgi:uncharacterized membrane protein YeaQ/YmgE (transglycosylase-associated protein family)
MLELIGWDVGMSLTAALALVVGALLIGILAHFIGDVAFPYEWAATGAAALVGGYLGSEAFGTLSTWGAEFDGMYIVPAIIGGVVLGGIVDALVRYLTSGSYVHHPRPV